MQPVALLHNNLENGFTVFRWPYTARVNVIWYERNCKQTSLNREQVPLTTAMW